MKVVDGWLLSVSGRTVDSPMEVGRTSFPSLEFKPFAPNVERAVFFFQNGYGVSVLRGDCSLAGSRGYYELALIHEDGSICQDIREYLTPEDVSMFMWRIEALSK